MDKEIADGERSNAFLDGCGVDYAHWIPVFEKDNIKAVANQRGRVPEACKFATPILAVVDEQEKAKSQYQGNGPGPRAQGCLVRVRKSLVRNRADSWSLLICMSSPQFRGWKNYGENSHKELVRVAAENGYKIAAWK
jgi:hypothetical protein